MSLFILINIIKIDMKNTLIILGHPNIKQSNATKAIMDNFSSEKEIKIVDLYKQYSNFQIDIKKEQKNLLEAKNIIFVFPIYWWSCPPLVKKYIDDVITWEFAYGTDDSHYKLTGKNSFFITSTGSPKESYTKKGDAGHSLDEYFLPIRRTFSEFTRMNFKGQYNNYNAKGVGPFADLVKLKANAVDIVYKVKKQL
ncbi:MAG: general stress protein [Mycoplasmataceae bacterium]|nr:general stress protein [Mycoplasmataceae bacterium]